MIIEFILQPFHNVFLSKKLCPVCTRSLERSVRRVTYQQGIELITCVCGRKYIHETTTDTYKRLSQEEIDNISELERSSGK